jgi:two-component system sensor histidine kinase KdpD
LVNLLDNATRYSPLDGHIGITARQQGDQAIIEVTDQGPGIPPGEWEKVFDMFYTASDSGDSLGTGLGLAICKGMVAAHAGSVAAGEGPGGKGTRMRITLPLAQQASPVPER